MTERFTLLTELGRGGMGVVWKARDEETGQVVALKLLRETYADDPDYVTRFERELELARRIDSVHVVKVLGFGVRQKVPYLALEYVDGPSLHDALAKHGPYSWPETRALLIQLTQGLADANAAGVIHRDVKPSNVLIGPDGVAKLTDFGIARGLDTTRMTATSTMLGTPAYLAPEGPKDARSDLYSLGIIGYELLTGVVPFKGTSHQEVIFEHVRTPPDLGRLPAEARPIIGWLLAKDPAERPQRASALLPVLYGAAQAPGATGPMPQLVPAPAPVPTAPARLPIALPRGPASTHTPGWGAPVAPVPVPSPAAGWQASPAPLPGARRAPQQGISARAPGRMASWVALIGAIVAGVTYFLPARGIGGRAEPSLAVIAVIAAAILVNGRGTLIQRRTLAVGCLLVGLALLWLLFSYLIHYYPQEVINPNFWWNRFRYDDGWLIAVFGAVAIVLGGLSAAMTTRSSVGASTRTSPPRQ